MNPQRKPLTPGRWWVATFFSVVADISNTIAQFMPMKAIFILALDDLPSFFPRFLIDLGVIWAAFILVGVAAIFAVVAVVTRRITESLAGPKDAYPRPHAESRKTASKTPLTFQEFTSEVLIVALLIGSSLVSAAFTAIVMLWLLLTATVMGSRIKRRPRRPPYHTATLEFQAEFKKFINVSNLWSTVAAALFTLVFAFPELGITGILIGAILLRRTQTAMGDLGLRLIKEPKPKFQYARKNLQEPPTETSIPLSAPLDFIASSSGKRLLVDSLKGLDLDYDRWQVVGQPNRNQLSLAAERSIGGDTVLLRIFATDRADMRDIEFEVRSLQGDFSPFLSSDAISASIGGLPGIVVRFSRGAAPLPQSNISSADAIEWQVLWETRVLTSREQRKVGKHLEALEMVRPIADPEKFLLPHLQVIAAINGPHQKTARQIVRIMPQLREKFLDGPNLYSLGGPVAPTNLLRLASGGIEPLDFSAVQVAKPGQSWSDSPNFGKYINSSADSLKSLQVWDVDEAELRAKIVALSKVTASRNFSALETKLKSAIDAFFSIEKAPVPQH